MGMRTKALKIATITAKGAKEACEEVINELPERQVCALPSR